MTAETIPLRRQLAILTILTVASFGFRLVPYFVGTSFLGKSETGEWSFWNANPVWAMFLLAFARCRLPWIGVLIPLSGYIITDILLQWVLANRGLETSSLAGRFTYYVLFFALSHLGWIIRKLPKDFNLLGRAGSILCVGMLGSLLFFVISNGIIWLTSTPSDGFYYYPQTWEGLKRCFTMALPFFKNALLGDMVFVAFLFSAYAGLERWSLATQEKQSLVTVES